MLDLIKKDLPCAIMVRGKSFPIHTDFRIWMKFVILFEKWDKKGAIDISFLFKCNIPVFYNIHDYDDLMNFAFPKNVIPNNKDSTSCRVLDYEIDSDYIYAAFYQQYGIDLMKEDMHWHVFNALMKGLHETKLTEIMGYRSYTGDRIKSQDDMYRKLKQSWELPVYETQEEIEAEQKFNNFFE